MAMSRSSLAPLFLLSVLVSGAAAARTVADDSVHRDNVDAACLKSQFPMICADGLTAKPDAQPQKATPRRLAELFVAFTAERGAGMATSLEGKLSTKDTALLKCFDSCGDDVEEAMAHLNGLIREPTDAKFLELKSWLSSTLGGTSTCEDACKDAPKNADKDEVVNNSLEFEKLLRVTLDLITEASGSMSADIALPPSDAAAPAYGAAAPFGGDASPATDASSSSADAPAAAEGPAASSESSSGGGASGPSAADSPAAAADAPSYGEASSAPAPSGSSSADADAPAGDSAAAPAPGSDETATDDDANDTKSE
ncbi:polysialoglycoprotein-like [Panicum virgatum]|uniref:Pectinesterase inhibitor domain-containing protein n=1 Tax=Panicum virgatum TaxID=38727 RepID=A0A8T0V772_PANVG|nr:polysialoglycoprotein-like [Panicum virgatum]KAG2632591.1 hypothetical protein PVAP13_2NG110300 [Panicum virgatum]